MNSSNRQPKPFIAFFLIFFFCLPLLLKLDWSLPTTFMRRVWLTILHLFFYHSCLCFVYSSVTAIDYCILSGSCVWKLILAEITFITLSIWPDVMLCYVMLYSSVFLFFSDGSGSLSTAEFLSIPDLQQVSLRCYNTVMVKSVNVISVRKIARTVQSLFVPLLILKRLIVEGSNVIHDRVG